MMQNFIDATRKALHNKNWYAALALALAMPDICGRLKDPSRTVGWRYQDWWTEFLLPSYSGATGVSSADAYALRCAFLHEGGDNISEQKARESLERFHFLEPTPGWVIHQNKVNNKLQLQVDIFVEDVCKGVDKWMAVYGSVAEIGARVDQLAQIYKQENGVISF